MLVSGITSFTLVLVLLLQTEAKPTSIARQKRAPNLDSYPDIYMEEIVPVLNDDIIDSLQTEQNQLTPEEVDQGLNTNKRGIQFPRLGRKRSILHGRSKVKEYADKMLNSMKTEVGHDIFEKLYTILNTEDNVPEDKYIII
uniref:Uncharacterized protein LOC111133394 isoform X2 n=1 Tax=Crassostrea virginica TaxID=6565 RepID=A0A8B8ED37_CRAVI|nr:uncharacterized protein LOC111133394 isoform X2 [Crassostrea virginica]